MKRETSRKGFTLVELMIVVAIVAILVALALPSYNRYILKANRGEALQLLMNWSNNQEIWRATHTAYADGTALNGFAVPTHDKYIFTVTDVGPTTPNTFTLTADPLGNQAKDEDRGVRCDPLTFNQSNAKTPTECW